MERKVDLNRIEGSTKYEYKKRIIDLVISVVGLVILSPIFIITAILIKLESKGPIIFKQERVGKDSKKFNIYKFRSMKKETPNLSTEEFTDSKLYITRVGRFIRSTSIDELPQIFNIIKGDMSIVGPRPVIDTENRLLTLRKINNIDKMMPGITGWAQINGRDNICVEEKIKYELEYMDRKSIKFDLYIIIMTVIKVIKKSDIKE